MLDTQVHTHAQDGMNKLRGRGPDTWDAFKNLGELPVAAVLNEISRSLGMCFHYRPHLMIPQMVACQGNPPRRTLLQVREMLWYNDIHFPNWKLNRYFILFIIYIYFILSYATYIICVYIYIHAHTMCLRISAVCFQEPGHFTIDKLQ